MEAIWFIAQIRQLYLIEDETYELRPAERKAVRRAKAPAFWRAMKQWALKLQAEPPCLPKSSLGKAVNYFLNEYTAPVGYLRDGRFQIDNNLMENDVRPSVVGRKRWLFIGHPDAGWRSAAGFNRVVAGLLRLRVLAAGGLGSKDERVAEPLRLGRGHAFPAAAVFLCSVIQFAFFHWQCSAIDRGCPQDYVRFPGLNWGRNRLLGWLRLMTFGSW